jgi:hypothetical protein
MGRGGDSDYGLLDHYMELSNWWIPEFKRKILAPSSVYSIQFEIN